MGDIRKKYDAALKAKRALEAVKGDKTIRGVTVNFLCQCSLVKFLFFS